MVTVLSTALLCSLCLAVPAAAGEPELHPWTLMLVPEDPAGGPDRLVEARLTSELLQAGFEIAVAPTPQDLEKLTTTLREIGPTASAADVAELAFGSSTFRVLYQGKASELQGAARYVLSVRVVHPARDRDLCQVTDEALAKGPAAPQTAADLAAARVAPALIEMLRAEQRREIELGRETLVTFRDPPPGSEASLQRLVERSCTGVQTPACPAHEFQATGRCKGDLFDLTKALDAGLRTSFPGVEIEITTKVGYRLTFAFPYTPARKQ